MVMLGFSAGRSKCHQRNRYQNWCHLFHMIYPPDQQRKPKQLPPNEPTDASIRVVFPLSFARKLN
jgi:hypothetical protein